LSINQHYNIIADDRELHSTTVKILRETKNINLSIQRLSVGDYEINKRLLVERKTLTDFSASIKDGRLFRQASKLACNRMLGIIILEGSSNSLAKTNMRREALQGALITVTIIFGIPVLRSLGPKESVQLMLYTINQVERATNYALPRAVNRPKGKEKIQLHILQGLPGVGPVRARRLLKSFNSVEAVFTAETEKLKNVCGIGRLSAEKIRWAVGESD